jgi:hypothetical protein
MTTQVTNKHANQSTERKIQNTKKNCDTGYGGKLQHKI